MKSGWPKLDKIETDCNKVKMSSTVMYPIAVTWSQIFFILCLHFLSLLAFIFDLNAHCNQKL